MEDRTLSITTERDVNDIMEYEVTGVTDPAVLHRCVKKSYEVFTYKRNGDVVAIVGIMKTSPLASESYLWATVRKDMQDINVIRGYKRTVNMLKHVTDLYAAFDPEDSKVMEWANWLGFTPTGVQLDGYELMRANSA